MNWLVLNSILVFLLFQTRLYISEEKEEEKTQKVSKKRQKVSKNATWRWYSRLVQQLTIFYQILVWWYSFVYIARTFWTFTSFMVSSSLGTTLVQISNMETNISHFLLSPNTKNWISFPNQPVFPIQLFIKVRIKLMWQGLTVRN